MISDSGKSKIFRTGLKKNSEEISLLKTSVYPLNTKATIGFNLLVQPKSSTLIEIQLYQVFGWIFT